MFLNDLREAFSDQYLSSDNATQSAESITWLFHIYSVVTVSVATKTLQYPVFYAIKWNYWKSVTGMYSSIFLNTIYAMTTEWRKVQYTYILHKGVKYDKI